MTMTKLTNNTEISLNLWSRNGLNSVHGFSDDLHFCKAILYDEIPDTSIRIWDLMIFVPNCIFLIYLLCRFQKSRDRVRQLNNFPILRNFHVFIYLCVIVSMMRCFVSVVMKVHTEGGDLLDKIFWVIVRFFLLSTEISVLVFGLFSGHLDVRQSIRRILSITLFIALVYSICQGSLEIIIPDASFFIVSKNYRLYGHGGMIFWFCTCMLCSIVYLVVVILPWTPCRNRLLLPTKQSFYVYAAILSILNLFQSVGTLLFYFEFIEGLCIVDISTYTYFTCFTPLVYFTFLSPFLAAGSSNSAASALVTTTAGSESGRNTGPAPLNRPTNLHSSGLRGAVNFSYRPQIDDELLDNEEDFASSVGSIGGLHFDHYGPYAYNQSRQGYLVYGASGIPRDISSFSIQTTAPDTMLEGQQEQQTTTESYNNSKSGIPPATNNPTVSTASESKVRSPLSGGKTMSSDHHHNLIESHMLQDTQQQQQKPTVRSPMSSKNSTADDLA